MLPDEVRGAACDDGMRRRRFIKLFHGARHDMPVVVMQESCGNILWNLINRDCKGMNILRVGNLMHQAGNGHSY